MGGRQRGGDEKEEQKEQEQQEQQEEGSRSRRSRTGREWGRRRSRRRSRRNRNRRKRMGISVGRSSRGGGEEWKEGMYEAMSPIPGDWGVMFRRHQRPYSQSPWSRITRAPGGDDE